MKKENTNSLMPDQRVLDISYALAKKVPDMQQRGVRFETAYGELELDDADSTQVAALIKTLLESKLAKLRKALA